MLLGNNQVLIKKTQLSDHRIIKCNLNFSNLERGKGYWKLDISHLENEDYKREILELFKNIDDSIDPISNGKLLKLKFVIISLITQDNPKTM